MNNSEKFIAFLESLKTSSNANLIESVKSGFALTEASVRGLQFPDVKTAERKRLPAGKSKPLSPEEQAARSAKFKREGAAANQATGRMAGVMKQIETFALKSPMDVEKWMNDVLKPAIKQGKTEIDSRYGTNSAKVGIAQRLKNAGKAILGESVDEDEDYEMPQEDHFQQINELRKIAPELFLAPERMTNAEFNEKWPKIQARREELLKTHPHLFR